MISRCFCYGTTWVVHIMVYRLYVNQWPRVSFERWRPIFCTRVSHCSCIEGATWILNTCDHMKSNSVPRSYESDAAIVDYVAMPEWSFDTTIFDNINVRQEDERAIEHFLRENEQIVKNKRKKSFRIAATKGALTSVAKLNRELKAVCAELKSNIDLSEAQWQEKINVCNAAKHEILKILKNVKDTDSLNNVKNNLEKRKKKRHREQLRREKWKKEKLLNAERRAKLHAEADSWIIKKQAVIEKEKQEENLRKDADMILSDVRSKRNDARKYLGILQELQNLRKLKANIARARGEHLSSAADEAFNNIIAKLIDQWSALDREYSIEEQGLKLMLKTDNEKRIEKQTKNLFEEWEHVLFGKIVSITEQSHKDLNSFVMIRMAWDKFVSSKNVNDDATTIPIGWIVPEKPSSAAWQKCLKKETSSNK